jgi:hypothetical protein
VKRFCQPAAVATFFGAVFGAVLLRVQETPSETEEAYYEHAPRAAVFEPSVPPTEFLAVSADSLPSFTEKISSAEAHSGFSIKGESIEPFVLNE